MTAKKKSGQSIPGFLADSMLGSICRSLRILGYSCIYSKDLGNGIEPPDDHLIKFAASQNLVFLTRDEELFSRAKDYCQTALVFPHTLDSQLRLVCKSFGLGFRGASKSFCPKCNGRIRPVFKISVKRQVWPKVYAEQKKFWRCEKCLQIYWRGSHWRVLKKRFSKKP